jgi:hypothetical protein
MHNFRTHFLAPALGVIAAILACGCASTATGNAPPSQRNWKSIFDGQTLNGWIPKIVGYPAGQDPLQTFRVKDGVIAVSYDGYNGELGGRFGHLFYIEPLKAYRLALDYRFTGEELHSTPPRGTPVNSGLMFDSESPELMTVEQGYPISIEGQLLGPYPEGKPRVTGSFCTMGTKMFSQGKPLDHCINTNVVPSPIGTWVHFELEVTADGHVTESLDGKTTVSMDRVELDPTFTRFPIKPVIDAAGGSLVVGGGYIALQSEGHPIEFRNIRIRSLQ